MGGGGMCGAEGHNRQLWVSNTEAVARFAEALLKYVRTAAEP